jgi:hypothetical protein
MMEAVRTPEISVNIYLTIRQYIPEDNFSVFHVRETLKCVAMSVLRLSACELPIPYPRNYQMCIIHSEWEWTRGPAEEEEEEFSYV